MQNHATKFSLCYQLWTQSQISQIPLDSSWFISHGLWVWRDWELGFPEVASQRLVKDGWYLYGSVKPTLPEITGGTHYWIDLFCGWYWWGWISEWARYITKQYRAGTIYLMMDAMTFLQRTKTLSIDSTNHSTERPGTFHQPLGIKDQSDQKDMEKVVTATLGAAQQVESRGCHFMCLVILPNQHEWIWNDLNDLNGVHWISCFSHFSPLYWPNCSWRSLKRRNHLITLTGWTLVKHSEALRSTWIT